MARRTRRAASLSSLVGRPVYTKDVPRDMRPCVREALKLALEQDPDALVGLAETAIELGLRGNLQAIAWVTENLSGKQATTLKLEGLATMSDEQLIAIRAAIEKSKD